MLLPRRYKNRHIVSRDWLIRGFLNIYYSIPKSSNPGRFGALSNYHKGFIKNLTLLKFTHLNLWDADQADRADIKEKNPFDPHNPRPTSLTVAQPGERSFLGAEN